MQRRKLDIDLVRGVLRRLDYSAGKSSYPFISGDTYAEMCDYRFSQKSSLAELNLVNSTFRLFLPAYLKDKFFADLNSNQSDFSGVTLVIHNDDHIPSLDEMVLASKRFKRIFCVNWLGDKDVAIPIPIGLENWSLLRNGIPRDFLKIIGRGLLPASKRSIKILSSFSISTNLIERSKAIEFSKLRSDVFQMPSFTSPKKYREILSNSAFVLSPPGNGADCHRTWEAMYLGAVPIVLEKFWPFNHLRLPVLVVEEWSDIPEMIASANDWNLISIEELKSEFLTFP